MNNSFKGLNFHYITKKLYYSLIGQMIFVSILFLDVEQITPLSRMNMSTQRGGCYEPNNDFGVSVRLVPRRASL